MVNGKTKFAHIIGVNDAFKDLALCNFELKNCKKINQSNIFLTFSAIYEK